jgi:glucose-1-phosphate adenylyltransferase
MNNMKVIRRMRQPYVIITPSYYVFTQDYEDLLQKHIESGADITLLYQKVNNAKSGYHRCDILNLNRQRGVKSIEINNGAQDDRNIFMDTFIMKRDLLVELVEKANSLSSIYTLTNIINLESDNLDIRAVQHKGYFATITDFKSYFDAHMGLLNNPEANAMFESEDIVYSPTSDSSPTRYYPGASVRNCIISNSCEIKGSLENCVLGRNVIIGKGAVLKNCVVLAHAIIGDGVVMENQVVDKWAQLINVKELIAPPEDPGYIRRDDIL